MGGSIPENWRIKGWQRSEKFGAMIGEGCQLGCNAVTNPGTVLGINSIVWPNVTVTGIHDQSSTHR